MKNTFIFLLLLISLSLQSQIITSTCTGSQSVIEKFKEDATKLAIRRLNQINSRDTIKVIVPNLTLDSVLSALIAVYNVKNFPIRDTIFDILKISANNPLVKGVSITTSDTSWSNQWVMKKTKTGFVGIDTFFDNYKLTLQSYNPPYSSGLFTTPLLLNSKALSDSIKLIKGVQYVTGGFNFDAPDISYEVEPSGNKLLTFSYRWGEYCSHSGCERSRRWKFRIYSDCKVEYLGVLGSLLDLVLSNSENTNINKPIDIYPNPTTNQITISSTYTFQDYAILDISGKTVLKGTLNSKNEIGVSTLTDGLYFLHLKNTSTQARAVGKFVVKH
jgi:Secretion system C-terminal sorting domain